MKTVSYPQCDSCGKTLEKLDDGVVLWGCLYRAVASTTDVEPIAGSTEGDDSAWCWACLDKRLHGASETA